jgi:hypothetical protein
MFVTILGRALALDTSGYNAEQFNAYADVNPAEYYAPYSEWSKEKGILPAVNDNEELILARLKEYLMDQIDLSNYSGKITDQALITAVFTSDNVEYTLFILSYGQIGTQYVIWLDTATLEQDTVDSIMWGAQLVKK